MATTKIKFRPSSVAGKEGTLFLQVRHKNHSLPHFRFNHAPSQRTSEIKLQKTLKASAIHHKKSIKIGPQSAIVVALLFISEVLLIGSAFI